MKTDAEYIALLEAADQPFVVQAAKGCALLPITLASELIKIVRRTPVPGVEEDFLDLRDDLSAIVGAPCQRSSYMQDANYEYSIYLPESILAKPIEKFSVLDPGGNDDDGPVLLISRWGNFVALLYEDNIRTDIREKILIAFADHALVHIPERLLPLPYPGKHRAMQGERTWGARYFGME